MTGEGGGTPERYRWTISEYVLRCELYRFRELLVEGEGDRTFFLDVLGRYGLAEIAVLDSDYFHIPREDVEDSGFEVGAKGRLLTLAAAICARATEAELRANVLVIVDRNYDEGLPPEVTCVAVATDGYSLENYVLSARALERFVRMVLGRDELPAGAGGTPPERRSATSGDDLFIRIVPASSEVAAVRRALVRIASGIGLFAHWIDYVTVASDGHAAVDGQTLFERVLKAAGISERTSDATKVLAEERERVTSNPFRYVRGADYVKVLHKVLKSSWGRRMAGINLSTVPTHAIRRWLLLAVDHAEVDEQALFQTIRGRFAA
jgi:hypothetical protein